MSALEIVDDEIARMKRQLAIDEENDYGASVIHDKAELRALARVRRRLLTSRPQDAEHTHAREAEADGGGRETTLAYGEGAVESSGPPSVAELLRFEREWPGTLFGKRRAIWNRFHLQPGRYYQELNRAIDTREALEADPVLTEHLLTQREIRRDKRRFLSGLVHE